MNNVEPSQRQNSLTLMEVSTIQRELLPASDSGLRLYAIWDAALGGEALLEQTDIRHQAISVTLLPGDERHSLRPVSPLLVDLHGKPELLEWVLRHGWGKHWGIYLHSFARFSEIYHHLFSLTAVRLPDNRTVHFRYHDPRVLNPFLAALSPEELNAFLGPVETLLMEKPDGHNGQRITRPKGMQKPEPAPIPASWTQLPDPWWCISPKQWEAIMYAQEMNFFQRVKTFLKENKISDNIENNVLQSLLHQAQKIGCSTEQHYLLFILISLSVENIKEWSNHQIMLAKITDPYYKLEELNNILNSIMHKSKDKELS